MRSFHIGRHNRGQESALADGGDTSSPIPKQPTRLRLPHLFRRNAPPAEAPGPTPEPSAFKSETSSTHDEAEDHQPIDPWQAAFDKLKPDEKEWLGWKEGDEVSVKSSLRLALDNVVDMTKKYTGVAPAVSSDDRTILTNLRDAARTTASCALRVKSVIDAGVKFDKSGYAALAWSVVSIGLELVDKDRERQEEVLKAAAFVAEVLERYSIIDERYNIVDADLQQFVDKELVSVYEAILRYSSRVLQAKAENSIQRTKYAFLALTSNLLKDLRSNIQNAEGSAEKRLRMVEYLTMTKAIDEIKQKVDLIGSKIDQSSSSDELAASRNREAILLALKPRFPNTRVDDIRDAQPNTFEWILSISKQESVGPDEGPDVITIPTWLRSGFGLFHISGKPGSGKSTLMKFLTTHVQTQKYLAEWAAFGNKQLIRAEFFIWKLGSDEQKTMKGLLRGLLFNIVEDHPDIVETLLPEHWKPELFVGTAPRSLSITNTGVNAAFQRLLRHPDISQRYKVCLFIDGLDEFDDKDMSHWKLAETLRNWTETARTETKLCVSSREDEPIMKELPSSQRIALHKLTAGDISTFVRDTLGRNKYFQKLHQSNHSGCDDLISSIVTDAEGVFLWVTLLLKQMEDALPSSGTSVNTLQRILRTTPKELEPYLQQILDSIPKHYRPGAKFVLAMALRMMGLHLAIDNQFSKAERERSDEQFKAPSFWNPTLSLFGLSYVFDAFEEVDRISCDFDWNISESVTLEEVENRTRGSVDRLKTWCNNLMDPISRQRAMPDVHASFYVPFDDQFAQFTHRSIPEFLISTFRRGSTALTFDDDDLAAGILAVTAAETRAGPTLWSFASVPGQEPDHRISAAFERKLANRLQHILFLLRLRPISKTSSILPMLEKLEDARVESFVYRPFHVENRRHDSTDIWKLYEFRPRDVERGHQQTFMYGLEKVFSGRTLTVEWDQCSTVMTHAAATGLFEYIHWKLENNPDVVKDTARLYSALCGVSASILQHGCSPASTSVLRLLLEAGAPYNVQYSRNEPGYEVGEAFSIWQLFDAPGLDDDIIDVRKPHLDVFRPNSPWNVTLIWYMDVVKESMIPERKRTRRGLMKSRKFTPDLWTSLETWLEFGARPPFSSKVMKQSLVAGVKYHKPPNTQKLIEYLA